MKQKKSTNSQRITQLEKAVVNLHSLILNYNNMIVELYEEKNNNNEITPDNKKASDKSTNQTSS